MSLYQDMYQLVYIIIKKIIGPLIFSFNDFLTQIFTSQDIRGVGGNVYQIKVIILNSILTLTTRGIGFITEQNVGFFSS